MVRLRRRIVGFAVILAMLQVGLVVAAPMTREAAAANPDCCPADMHHGMCPMHPRHTAARASSHSAPMMCACHHSDVQVVTGAIAILPDPSSLASDLHVESTSMARRGSPIARVSVPDPPPPRR